MAKKQRWRFTKNIRFCEECHKRLDTRNDYAMEWNTCNSNCYMNLVGMSWGDFIGYDYF